MIRRPPRSTHCISSAASDVYKRQVHAHESGNAILANALEESGLGFDTAQFKGWPTDPKAFDGADSVVIFCNGGKGHLVMNHLDQFEKLIDSGVGFVFMHYAVEVPIGRAGVLMREAMGGYFETHWSVNPHWTAEFKSLPKHPITRGVKPFTQKDEWYSVSYTHLTLPTICSV